MKPYGKEPKSDRNRTRKTTDRITGSENDFNAANLEEWERRVFRAAVLEKGGQFTVWRRHHDTMRFDNFPEAAMEAGSDPRALVYAVGPSGRSFVVVRSQWRAYLALYMELTGMVHSVNDNEK